MAASLFIEDHNEVRWVALAEQGDAGRLKVIEAHLATLLVVVDVQELWHLIP